MLVHSSSRAHAVKFHKFLSCGSQVVADDATMVKKFTSMPFVSVETITDYLAITAIM